MNILITSGGTTEQIDSVRSITNTSTGMLGNLIAKAFVKLCNVNKVYYICGKTAILPKYEKVEIIPVGSVKSLEESIRNVLKKNDIDIIVHSMAVSDYRVKSLTSSSALANTMLSQAELFKNINENNADSIVTNLLENSENIILNNGKIKSYINNMVLLMEHTPKIISLFRTLTPKSILVGFKLLNNVNHEILIDTAFSVLKDNSCDFVLANDLCDIYGEKHIGYLIDQSKNYQCYQTKKDIAHAIVMACISQYNTNPD